MPSIGPSRCSSSLPCSALRTRLGDVRSDGDTPDHVSDLLTPIMLDTNDLHLRLSAESQTIPSLWSVDSTIATEVLLTQDPGTSSSSDRYAR